MWKLMIAVLAALFCAACGSGPALGSLLPNGYIAPQPGERTASITFAGVSGNPDFVWQAVQQDKDLRRSGGRFVLLFAGPAGAQDLPPNGWYNTVTQQIDDAARTIEFSAETRLYFHIDSNTETHYCYSGFSFIPAPGAAYAAQLRLDGAHCWVELIDKATGRPPESLRPHDPLARHAPPYTID